VSRYSRFIYAMNLQCIAELLRQCWAFSVALDMATHMATSYCDVSDPHLPEIHCA
jgi:hypothetical protein